MDSFTTNQGYKPYTLPSCPGCAQTAMPAQTGQTAMPQSPGAVFTGQLPTGIPSGTSYGTGSMLEPGAFQQTTGMQPILQQPISQQMPQQPISQPAAQAQNQNLAPIVPWNQPMPVTVESLQYMNGFMRTQIGRKVTAEFLIGTGTLVDKTGTLLAVGANYILINELETDDILLCDFYSIKFIKFYY